MENNKNERDIDDGLIVAYDEPFDPENPQQWSMRRKIGTLLLISSGALVCTPGSSILSPALRQILRDFHSTNLTLGTFAMSVYQLGMALGPLVLSGLSEIYGRAVLYHTCNFLFLAFTLGAALSPSLNALIGFRLLAGFAASTSITIGSGTIADIFEPTQRGRATSVYALGPLLGPAIAPIIGGYLGEAKGWRWINWFVLILGGVFTVATITFFRETYHPIILARKTKRKQKETGNHNLRSKLAPKTSPRTTLLRALMRPLKMLFLSPLVSLPCAALALIIGYLVLLLTTMATIFQQQYQFSEGTSGLVYIPVGIGNLIGLWIFVTTSDKAMKRAAAKGFSKPEVRLQGIILGGPLVCSGLILYGWTAEYRVQWIVPMIGTAMFGIGVMAFMMPITTYLIDVWRQHAASAVGANVFLRSVFASVIPLVAFKLYDAMSLGWGNTLLGLISLLTMPLPILFYRYGDTLRERFKITV